MNDIIVTVVGNVVDEVQLRYTADGTPVASFRLAHNDRYFSRATESWVDAGCSFFTVSCWRGLGRNVADSLVKGMPVIVSGRLRQKEYEREREGQTVRTRYDDIEAIVVGPDLSRGVAAFRRVKGAAVRQHEARSIADAMGAQAVEASMEPASDSDDQATVGAERAA